MSTALEELVAHARHELAKTIVGQREALDLLLLTIVCDGHALLEGVPGLAKTLAVRSLARILQMRFQRVQCTPDLMPADIIGANIFNMSTGSFALHQGPVFTDLLLVNISVALLAGLLPIPGGIGVAEGGLTYGLVRAGMPEETAFAAVICYRMASFYLPPIWGFFAMRWLERNRHL